MISEKVRNALKELTEQVVTSAEPGVVMESAGNCWAELIGEVIEITRQNTGAETLKPAAKRRFMHKDEIIIRAIRAMDFDLADLGLEEPN